MNVSCDLSSAAAVAVASRRTQSEVTCSRLRLRVSACRRSASTACRSPAVCSPTHPLAHPRTALLFSFCWFSLVQSFTYKLIHPPPPSRYSQTCACAANKLPEVLISDVCFSEQYQLLVISSLFALPCSAFFADASRLNRFRISAPYKVTSHSLSQSFYFKRSAALTH